jgi:hypothetical protein
VEFIRRSAALDTSRTHAISASHQSVQTINCSPLRCFTFALLGNALARRSEPLKLHWPVLRALLTYSFRLKNRADEARKAAAGIQPRTDEETHFWLHTRLRCDQPRVSH